VAYFFGPPCIIFGVLWKHYIRNFVHNRDV